MQNAVQQKTVFDQLFVTTVGKPAACHSSSLCVQIPILSILSHDHYLALMIAVDTLLVYVGLGAMFFSLALIGAQVVQRTGDDIGRYLGSLQEIVQSALIQIRLSARRVGVPIVWLIPAYFIASLAKNVTQYYNLNSNQHVPTWQLFIPIHLDIPGTEKGFLLGTLALLGTLFAIIIYADREVFRSAWASLLLAGRTLTLTAFPIIYGLAAINAAALIFPEKATPFQAGMVGLLAIVVFILSIVFEKLRSSRTAIS